MIIKYEPKPKRFKNAIIKTVYGVLGTGMKATIAIDSKAKKIAEEFEEGFTLKMEVAPKGPALCMKKEKGTFVKIPSKEVEETKFDLVITFKNTEATFPVMLGLQGVGSAYAETKFVLAGPLQKGVAVVDLVNLTEAYLFPKFITRKLMDVVPKKESNSLRCYMRLLIGG